MSPKWLVFVVLLLGAAPPADDAPPAPESPGGAPFQLDPVDRSVDPCVDFYAFSCNQWMAAHPLPPDRARFGRFDLVADRNELILRDILEEAQRDEPGRSPDTQKIGDLYAACMDQAALDAKGAAPLAPYLARIEALGDKAQLAGLLAELHGIGVNAFFSAGAEQDLKNAPIIIATVDEGGIGLPDRDDYTSDDPHSAEVRARYRQHVTRMLGLLGDAPARATAETDDVLRIEHALGAAFMTRVERRDPANIYHKLTLAELQAASPSFDWAGYFSALGAPPIESLDVAAPIFVRTVSAILDAEPISAVRSYLRWRLLSMASPFLASSFEAEHFDFYSRYLRGIQQPLPRWRRCVHYTDNALGDALGQPFVARTFGVEGKQRTQEMVEMLEAALRDDIAGLAWMTPETKARALEKLAAIVNKVGYPDVWRDYSTYDVRRDDLLGDVARGVRYELSRELAKIGKPADKREWSMTPPTVNAYYDPTQNTINFPAGILQPPFYDNKADDAVNLGGIGSVIGHELTHGFDDEGRKFDAVGNLRDWWTPADSQAFDERARCFVDQYSGYVATDSVRVNGRLTLGENIADNGGLRVALAALRTALAGKEAPLIDGMTPEQRLFVSWGQDWCQNQTDEAARLQATTDPHSPGRFRVNGVVSNMPEFQAAFGCSVGQPMVRPAPCKIW